MMFALALMALTSSASELWMGTFPLRIITLPDDDDDDDNLLIYINPYGAIT